MDTESSAQSVTPAAAPLRIRLESALTAAGTAQLKEQLLDALQAGRCVTLDAEAVEQVDTAALQLLLAFSQDGRNRGALLTWAQPPEMLRRAARLLGMTDALGLGQA